MRWLPLLLLLACDSASEGEAGPDAGDDAGFEFIGGGADARMEPPPSGPLRLRFEPLEHDAGALRLTDIVFLPQPADELLVADKDGEIIHLRLVGDRLERLGAFQVPEVWSDSDAGLISLALDPDFATNRWVYAGLSTSQEANEIRRYTLGPDYEAVPDSETLVFALHGEGAPRSWHNVGSIGFTDEGYLWALFGDKVLERFALDTGSALGALIRIIPLAEGGYEVPPDNPYADGSGHPAVYAKGMRSPWKGLYRDGTWWFGDVGLDDWEELNHITAPGQSFGWPDFEGPCNEGCPGHEAPVLAYDHSGSHPFVLDNPEATSDRLRSISVGWQHVAGTEDPYEGRWRGVVTFADAFSGFVRALPAEGGESWHVGHLQYATGWAQGPDGYVYVTALGTWPVDGPLRPAPITRALLDE